MSKWISQRSMLNRKKGKREKRAYLHISFSGRKQTSSHGFVGDASGLHELSSRIHGGFDAKVA